MKSNKQNSGTSKVFVDIMSQRELKKQAAIKDAREKVDEAYYAMIDKINEAIERDGAEKYRDLIDELNALTEKYSQYCE